MFDIKVMYESTTLPSYCVTGNKPACKQLVVIQYRVTDPVRGIGPFSWAD